MTKFVVKRFGDLVPGDRIVSPGGDITRVITGYKEHVPTTMYEVETDSGAVVKASGNHLWYIETSLDIEMHRNRRDIGRSLLSGLSSNTLTNLQTIAEYKDDVSTSLIDMVILLSENGNRQVESVLTRIAESLGPVEEENVHVRTLDTDEDEIVSTVRQYDARRFAQQILSLTGRRTYRKKYPLIVGRVVTTEEMLELSEIFDIFIPDPD